MGKLCFCFVSFLVVERGTRKLRIILFKRRCDYSPAASSLHFKCVAPFIADYSISISGFAAQTRWFYSSEVKGQRARSPFFHQTLGYSILTGRGFVSFMYIHPIPGFYTPATKYRPCPHWLMPVLRYWYFSSLPVSFFLRPSFHATPPSPLLRKSPRTPNCHRCAGSVVLHAALLEVSLPLTLGRPALLASLLCPSPHSLFFHCLPKVLVPRILIYYRLPSHFYAFWSILSEGPDYSRNSQAAFPALASLLSPDPEPWSCVCTSPAWEQHYGGTLSVHEPNSARFLRHLPNLPFSWILCLSSWHQLSHI